jgi:hypothetical protein
MHRRYLTDNLTVALSGCCKARQFCISVELMYFQLAHQYPASLPYIGQLYHNHTETTSN